MRHLEKEYRWEHCPSFHTFLRYYYHHPLYNKNPSQTLHVRQFTYQALSPFSNAPKQPGINLKQITGLFVVCYCDTKRQRFANSRLCDVESFYSLSSSEMCLSLRRWQSSYSQPECKANGCMWFWVNCYNLMVYHLLLLLPHCYKESMLIISPMHTGGRVRIYWN